MKVAAGFIVYRKYQGFLEYLLLKTSYGEHHWTPPKGHVDPGEKAEETALRETQEEAGLTQKELRIDWDWKKELQYNVNGKPKAVYYWPAELLDSGFPVTMSEEHTEFKWLKFQDALVYAKYPDMQQVMSDLNVYLQTK